MDERLTKQEIAFEWNTDKARINLSKHGISFVVACEAFFDPFVVVLDDEVVDDEQRGSMLGMTEQGRLLYVVYTLRKDAVRLISARPATPGERRIYEYQ